MISKKIFAKFLFKYIFNPTLVFFICFAFTALFGLYGKELLLVFAIIFPWLFILLLFFYTPLLMFLFTVSKMDTAVKINHVLEHGTIYFLKRQYSKKHKMGGKACIDGFRIYGEIHSIQDIKEAFEKLKAYLEEGKTSAILSKLCGSSTPILEGLSFLMLTATIVIFAFTNFSAYTIKFILMINIVFIYYLDIL